MTDKIALLATQLDYIYFILFHYYKDIVLNENVEIYTWVLLLDSSSFSLLIIEFVSEFLVDTLETPLSKLGFPAAAGGALKLLKTSLSVSGAVGLADGAGWAMFSSFFGSTGLPLRTR